MGALVPLALIRALLEYPLFKGIVVVDEAYIDFADDVAQHSAASLVKEYANPCVMQTLSKSFCLAAIRLGVALAQPPFIRILSNTKAPYNISTPTAHLARAAIAPSSVALVQKKVRALVAGRAALITGLAQLAHFGVAPPIGGNDANFVVVPILARPADAEGAQAGAPDSARAFRLYREARGVVVRYRCGEPGCAGCLRIAMVMEAGAGGDLRVLRSRYM